MFFTPNQLCYYEGKKFSDIKGKIVVVDKTLPSGMVIANCGGVGYLLHPTNLRPASGK